MQSQDHLYYFPCYAVHHKCIRKFSVVISRPTYYTCRVAYYLLFIKQKYDSVISIITFAIIIIYTVSEQ